MVREIKMIRGTGGRKRSVSICATFVVLWTLVAGNSAAEDLKLPTSVMLVPENHTSAPMTLGKSEGETLTAQVTQQSSQCVDSAFAMPGQAWHVNLSVGGITLRATQQPGVILPSQRTTELKLISSEPSSSPPVDVAVLVIDDFQPIDIALDEDNPGHGLSRTIQLNHGTLVATHLASVLEASHFSRGAPGGAGWEIFTRGNRTVRIVRVDYGDLRQNDGPDIGLVDTVDLAAKLYKISKDLPSTYVVVNMSFSMFPCIIMQRYQTLRDEAAGYDLRYPLNQYLSALEELNWPNRPAGNHNELEKRLTNISPQDPLREWLDNLKTRYTVVSVASGGNYGLTFQTMPAAWPDVLGVGARLSTVPSSGGKAEWSDRSDVIEVGQWFKPSNTQSPFVNFAYRGTSFSAPTVAAAFATKIGRPGCMPTPLTVRWFGIPKKANRAFAGVFTAKCN